MMYLKGFLGAVGGLAVADMLYLAYLWMILRAAAAKLSPPVSVFQIGMVKGSMSLGGMISLAVGPIVGCYLAVR
jgi:hypothetical protein